MDYNKLGFDQIEEGIRKYFENKNKYLQGVSRKLMPEKDITKQIRGILKMVGFQHRKIWQGPMSDKGISDIIGTIPPCGRKLAIEVKKEGWEPPERTNIKAYKRFKYQLDFIIDVNRAGGHAFFANTADIVIDELGLRDRFIC